MPSKMVGNISWPCGGLLPSLGRDCWLGGQQAATTSRSALGTFQVSDERDRQRRKNRTGLPRAAPSLCPLQRGKPAVKAASPKPPFWPMKLFHPKMSPRHLEGTSLHRNLRAKQPRSQYPTLRFALSASAVGTWQRPCHLWLYVHCLVQMPH